MDFSQGRNTRCEVHSSLPLPWSWFWELFPREVPILDAVGLTGNLISIEPVSIGYFLPEGDVTTRGFKRTRYLFPKLGRAMSCHHQRAVRYDFLSWHCEQGGL